MLDLESRYTADGYGGVAWRVLGHETIRDEDYEWTGIETVNEDRVLAVMVGDDRVFTFDVEEMTPISEGDYCPECGQVGCTAGVV